MTTSKIKMKERNGQWCWSVTVKGLLNRKGCGCDLDYHVAYQDAFNFILNCSSILPLLSQ